MLISSEAVDPTLLPNGSTEGGREERWSTWIYQVIYGGIAYAKLTFKEFDHGLVLSTCSCYFSHYISRFFLYTPPHPHRYSIMQYTDDKVYGNDTKVFSMKDFQLFVIIIIPHVWTRWFMTVQQLHYCYSNWNHWQADKRTYKLIGTWNTRYWYRWFKTA